MDSGEGALLALKVARLEQQCTVLRQETAVASSEHHALTECVGTMLRLVSGFVVEVQRELARPHASGGGARLASSSDGEKHHLVEGSRHLPAPPSVVQEFVDAPKDQKAECAILATRHVEETLRNLFPFLLRCVRGMSADRSARSSPVNDAAPPSSSSELPLSSSESPPHHAPNDEGNHPRPRASSTRSVVHGLLSDEHVRAILENIEYDRRMKLMVKLFGELIHRLNGESVRALTATAAEALQHRTLGLPAENLSPVALSLDGSGRAEQRRQQFLEAASPSGFTIPPPLTVHTSYDAENEGDLEGPWGHHDGSQQRQQHTSDPFDATRPSVVRTTTTSSDVHRNGSHHGHHFNPFPNREGVPFDVHRMDDAGDDVVLPIATADGSFVEDEPTSNGMRHGGIGGEFYGNNNPREQSVVTASDAVHEAVSSISSEDDDEAATAAPLHRGHHHHHDDASAGSSVRSGGGTAPMRRVAFGFDVAEYRETIDTASLAEQETLRIVRIRAGSAADIAGLVEGDRLEKVNGFSVSTHSDMEAVADVLRLEPLGTPVTLTVVRRNRQRLRITVHMETACASAERRQQGQHALEASPPTASHRTPVRRDLLGTYEISPVAAVRSELTPSPQRGGASRRCSASDDPLLSGVDTSQQHVVYNDGSMARRLNQTLERLKDIQRRREELQTAKSQLRVGRQPSQWNGGSSALTSRSGSPQSMRSVDISSSVEALVAFESSAHRTPRHLRASLSSYVGKRQSTPSPQRSAVGNASPQRVSGSPLPSPRMPSPNAYQKSAWR